MPFSNWPMAAVASSTPLASCVGRRSDPLRCLLTLGSGAGGRLFAGAVAGDFALTEKLLFRANVTVGCGFHGRFEPEPLNFSENGGINTGGAERGNPDPGRMGWNLRGKSAQPVVTCLSD